MARLTVSVIVPLYNKGDFIGQTLGSVRAQGRAPDEILVIDDGSTDGSAEAVLAWQSQAGYPALRLIRQDNAGVSAARNRGIAEARGEFVAFLDADDLWEPGFLGVCMAVLEENPGLDAAFGRIVEEGQELAPGPEVGWEAVEDYPVWFIRHRGRGLWSSNTVARRSTMADIGGFPVGVHNGEDTDTWFRLSFEGKLAHIPGARALYRKVDGDSLSRRFRAVRPIVIDTLEERLAQPDCPPSERRSLRTALRYFHSAYALALAQNGRRRVAIRELASPFPLGILGRSWLRAVKALGTGE